MKIKRTMLNDAYEDVSLLLSLETEDDKDNVLMRLLKTAQQSLDAARKQIFFDNMLAASFCFDAHTALTEAYSTASSTTLGSKTKKTCELHLHDLSDKGLRLSGFDALEALE